MIERMRSSAPSVKFRGGLAVLTIGCLAAGAAPGHGGGLGATTSSTFDGSRNGDGMHGRLALCVNLGWLATLATVARPLAKPDPKRRVRDMKPASRLVEVVENVREKAVRSWDVVLEG
jgi:hypothetical protein